MTDRRVGGEGASVDLRVGRPQVGSEGLDVDVVVSHPQSEAGQIAVQVDFTFPKGPQTASLGTTVDFTTGMARRLATIGLMVDYIASLVPANAARWSGAAFEMGTNSSLVYFASGAFQSSGTKPVVWATDHFEIAP